MKYKLSISKKKHEILFNHLFPGDNKEAVSIILCGRNEHDNECKLSINDIIIIPYANYSIQTDHKVKWSTSLVENALKTALKKNLAIFKIHSHPTGLKDFSMLDDESDKEFFDSIYGWFDSNAIHGSLIMLPEGEIIGRIVTPDLNFKNIDRISLVSDTISIWDSNSIKINKDIDLRTIQSFGLGTVELLKKLKVGVVGCSGTGSPLIAQLVRLGVGEFVLIDPDKMEIKNLNRIYYSTLSDAQRNIPKVNVIKDRITEIGLGTRVTTYNVNLYDSIKAIKSLSMCDIIFGCVDSIDGRHLLNLISTFYVIPYIDLGIKLIADGKGNIESISGAIHYILPGQGSLLSRGVYTSEGLRAAGLLRTNPEQYQDDKKHGYIENVDVESPAVISINTQVSSIAINEFLARIHPYRYDDNSNYSITKLSLTDSYILYEPDNTIDRYLEKYVGRGSMKPQLNMPELNKE